MDAMPTLIQPALATRDDNAHEADAVLLARCRAGEREAFGLLLHRYRDRIVNLAYQLLHQRDDAEDVAQEAFTKAFTAIHSFRGEAQLFTWLYRITVNLCRQRRRRAKTWEPLDDVGQECSNVEEQVVTKLMFEQALDGLSDPLRVVFILREMHDLSYDEVAAVLGIPVGTVCSRLSEARRKFKQLWAAAERKDLP